MDVGGKEQSAFGLGQRKLSQFRKNPSKRECETLTEGAQAEDAERKDVP